MNQLHTSASNPFHGPSFSRANRVARFLWGIVYTLLFRTSPRPLHAWRTFLLRLFGAKIGAGSHFYPHCRVWAPWNLVCGEHCGVADEATIYNPSEVILGNYCTISQQAYLCGASHDHSDPDFPLISASIAIESHAWICARATVQMGVTVREGAVLGLASLATKDLEPWTIYGGIPARKIKERRPDPAAPEAPRSSDDC